MIRVDLKKFNLTTLGHLKNTGVHASTSLMTDVACCCSCYLGVHAFTADIKTGFFAGALITVKTFHVSLQVQIRSANLYF